MQHKIPIVLYKDIESNKYIIYEDNRNKSGIYLWTNILNNKRYIGSTINLTCRFRTYFSIPFLNKELLRAESLIYRAILKYGYSNFKLDILEYCDQELLIEKEQYYIDLLKPEYNILRVGGSRLGTGIRTKVVNIKDFSEVEYSSVREAARSLNISHVILLQYCNTNKLFKENYLISNSTVCKKPSNGLNIQVQVFDSSMKFVTEFDSIRNLAKFLTEDNIIVSTTRISNHIKFNKLYKNKYYFKLV